MINAKDLRIGNTFWDNYGGYYNVTSINCNKVGEAPNSVCAKHVRGGAIGSFGCDAIEPVPLTPEILGKCGFEIDESIQQDFSYVLKLKARISLVYYKGDSSCLSIEQDGKLIDLASGGCNYLHQLQNLYFALTGEELTYTK